MENQVEETIRTFVDYIIPIVEAIGAIVIAVGVIVAFVTYALSELRVRPVPYERVRLQLGRFLALGLEFQLGSDILSTAVSPSFAEIGKLGAIATIRTVLNYFLAQELAREREAEARSRGTGTAEGPAPSPRAGSSAPAARSAVGHSTRGEPGERG